MSIKIIFKKILPYIPKSILEKILNLMLILQNKKIRILHHNGYWSHSQSDIPFKYYLKRPSITFSFEELNIECQNIYFYKYKPQKGDLCIDVGAGYGYEALLMSSLVGNSGKVYCFEPAPSSFRLLYCNTIGNNLINTFVYNTCIYKENKIVKIIDNEDDYLSNKINEDGLDVEAITLDQFVIEKNINYIDYLKVNIEGSEKFLVDGFKSVGIVKNIAISCHDFLYHRTGDLSFVTKELIINYLKNNNFKIFTQSTNQDYIDDWIYGKNMSFH
jgi:FkbM family methyltransferase